MTRVELGDVKVYCKDPCKWQLTRVKAVRWREGKRSRLYFGLAYEMYVCVRVCENKEIKGIVVTSRLGM